MIRVNEALAYWIGVVQTDGSLTKSHGLATIQFGVSEKSLPMLKKFSEITKSIFSRTSNTPIDKRGYYKYKISVQKLLNDFKILDIKFGDPPSPPRWMQNNPQFFGAYLAGVIDGDGDVRIKRPKYPHFTVRITSGNLPKELIREIKKQLGCGVFSAFRSRVSYLDGRRIFGRWVTTEFYISQKNKEFIRNYVLPHMTLTYKSNKIRNFIN